MTYIPPSLSRSFASDLREGDSYSSHSRGVNRNARGAPYSRDLKRNGRVPEGGNNLFNAQDQIKLPYIYSESRRNLTKVSTSAYWYSANRSPKASEQEEAKEKLLYMGWEVSELMRDDKEAEECGVTKEAQNCELKIFSMLLTAFNGPFVKDNFGHTDFYCEKACEGIARELHRRMQSDSTKFNVQDLTVFLHTLSKHAENSDYPKTEDSEYQKAGKLLAREVSKRLDLEKEQISNAQELSKQMNPDEQSKQIFTAQRLTDLVKALGEFELREFQLNGLESSEPYREAFEKSVCKASDWISKGRARDFNPRGLTVLVEAFSRERWNDNKYPQISSAFEQLASEVSKRLQSSKENEKFTHTQLITLKEAFLKFKDSGDVFNDAFEELSNCASNYYEYRDYRGYA